MNSPTSGLNSATQRATSAPPGGYAKRWDPRVGEELLNYIRASFSDPSWAETLPLFAEVKRIFTAEELRGYFATTTRVGPAAHGATVNSM
jgi:hypothetical protein